MIVTEETVGSKPVITGSQVKGRLAFGRTQDFPVIPFICCVARTEVMQVMRLVNSFSLHARIKRLEKQRCLLQRCFRRCRLPD